MNSNNASAFTNHKIGKLEVVLEKQNLEFTDDIFFTGQTLRGHVHLKVNYPLKAVGIVLRCVGKTKLGNVTKTIPLTLKPIVLHGKDRGRRHVTIPANNEPHRYNFTIDLPSSLPPSIECGDYFVRYYCQAKVIRIQARNTLRTGHKEFLVYQTNSNFTNELSEPQEPTDHEATLKPLHITYQLPKTAFYIGDTPTVIGEIYNSGKSTAKVKIGIDVVQTTRINGEINLGVKSFSRKYKKKQEGFGHWSEDKSIPPTSTETFSAVFDLRSTPPTSTCEQIDIKHELILKVLIHKKLSITKPQPHLISHDIIIGRSSNQPTPMRRSTSGVSIGRGSMKRKQRSASRPQLQDVEFNRGQSYDSVGTRFTLGESHASQSFSEFDQSLDQSYHSGRYTDRQISYPTPQARGAPPPTPIPRSYTAPPPKYSEF